MKTRFFSCAVLLAMASGFSTWADTTLKVGDPAPKLAMAKWVQGDPVTGFASDKVYIVEFWATWCGPCRASIPHLNGVYQKFKDKGLVVIGQDCWENNDDLVAPFVKDMGDKMTYRVALDDKKTDSRGAMAMTWMAAAGQNGIPTAFVIDKNGKIVWIGHPMALDESMIADLLAGKYDPAKAAKKEAELKGLREQFATARKEKDWAKAAALLDDIEKQAPEGERAYLEMDRFNLLLVQKDYTAAFKVVERMSDATPTDAMLQNQLAWQLLTDPQIEKPDFALAEKMAKRAVDATKSPDPNCLDTLALAYFKAGNKEQAVATETQAADLSTGSSKTDFQRTLAEYKVGDTKPDLLRRQAQQLEQEGKWTEAEAAFREELALEQKLPGSTPALWQDTVQKLAGLLARAGNFDAVDQLFSNILTPEFVKQKESAELLGMRAGYYARSGRWKEAKEGFASVINLEPDRVWNYHLLAPVLVQMGDIDGYRKLCAKIMGRFGATTDPTDAERVAKCCLLLADSGVDLAKVCKLAQVGLDGAPDDPWHRFTVGLAEYRLGQFEAAEKTLNSATVGQVAKFILAMTQYRLDQAEKARATLAEANAFLKSKMPRFEPSEPGYNGWDNWLFALAFQREANGLIDQSTVAESTH